LGKKAISDSGLVYYIDARFSTDGTNDWISLSMGVDPDKMPAMQALLRNEITRLRNEPPTDEEIAESRSYLRGRYISAAQSNPELADRLTLQWILLGRLENIEDFEKRLEAASRQDILNILPAITFGSVAAVKNPAEDSD
jgi:predicted Zn-dependent peptidase